VGSVKNLLCKNEKGKIMMKSENTTDKDQNFQTCSNLGDSDTPTGGQNDLYKLLNLNQSSEK
jgi:hypothetical protein